MRKHLVRTTLTTGKAVRLLSSDPSVLRLETSLVVCVHHVQTMAQLLVSLTHPDGRLLTNPKFEAYQAVSPIYEASISRSYSTDLQSPSNIPQRLNVTGFNDAMSGQSNLVDCSNSPAFTEQHPILQPGPHTNMRYQALDLIPKLETHSHVMKQEKLTEDEDFQHGSSAGPAYIFSANTHHSNPAMPPTDPGFYARPEVRTYPAQFSNPQGFASAEAAYEPSFGYLLPSQPDEPETMTPIQQKPAPTKRGPFKDPQKRIKTAQTRKMGSCIRCRMQRIRVSCTISPSYKYKLICHGSARLMKNRLRTRMHHVNAARKSV